MWIFSRRNISRTDNVWFIVWNNTEISMNRFIDQRMNSSPKKRIFLTLNAWHIKFRLFSIDSGPLCFSSPGFPMIFHDFFFHFSKHFTTQILRAFSLNRNTCTIQKSMISYPFQIFYSYWCLLLSTTARVSWLGSVLLIFK